MLITQSKRDNSLTDCRRGEPPRLPSAIERRWLGKSQQSSRCRLGVSAAITAQEGGGRGAALPLRFSNQCSGSFGALLPVYWPSKRHHTAFDSIAVSQSL